MGIKSKAILVFAKAPRPGHVKTRLRGKLTAQQAADVHRACLRDTARLVSSVAGCAKWLRVAGEPETAHRVARELGLSTWWRWGVQRGRDLGDRLGEAFHSYFSSGVKKVVVIGTDTPWMGRERIVRAFQLLDAVDVVLGPTEDGGYYLVGARRVIPEMFKNIPWGSREVLAQTLEALRRAGASYRLLRRDFDLDRPEDLARAGRLLKRKKIRAEALRRWVREEGWMLIIGSSRLRRLGGQNRKPRPGRG